MDLYSAESKKIQTLVQDWSSHPEQELEATFGAGGVVDATTFLNIAQRLRAKGYEPLPQDDRMSILTPNHIRLSLQGLGVLQNYCQTNSLGGKPYTAMIKDRSSLESQIDLEEYQCRIKSRREIALSADDPRIREMMENWAQVKKAYRLIRRWTFKGKGMRIDMSIVRSTPKDSRGEYRWARTFQDFNLFASAPIYEVEVELLREEATSAPEEALKCLIRGMGEILRAIQKNTLLIRKSVRDKVLSQYVLMNGSDKFRGVAPITLERSSMVAEVDEKVPNIRTGYNVTDKADGLRCLGFCDSKGELYLIDMGMTVYRTGLKNEECADSLLDGEWVTKNKEGKAMNHFLLFDIYVAPGKEAVHGLPFAIPGAPEAETERTRWHQLREWVTLWNTDGKTADVAKGMTDATRLRVAMKTFIVATGTEPTSIFKACAKVLDAPQIYNTDGLILTPNSLPLPAKSGDTFYEQFKWKPAIDNSIDFLVNIEKDTEIPTMDKVTTGIHPNSGETARFKTLRLYVGSVRDSAYDDPRSTMLNQLPLPNPKAAKKQVYKPVLFTPSEFPDTMANTCYCNVTMDTESGQEVTLTEHTDEPITNRSIVEMRYDPLQEPGWRWIPMRIRHDKTERLQRGIIARTLNSEKVANSVWNSIHDPVTVSMIRTGAEEPLEEESRMFRRADIADIGRTYYDRKSPAEDLLIVRGMRDFHNRWIKGNIMYDSVLAERGKTIVDYACGKAGDLQKWRFGKASLVMGIDVAGDNIRDPHNGAYRRYMDTVVQYGKDRVPRMIFAIGNSSKRLITGEAGATPEERDILRSVFGKSSPEGPVPKMIEMEGAGALRAGADVGVCMFAIHYFFETKETLDGFLQNVADTIKVGGYFMGTCFDGGAVFNMLRGVEKGQSKVGMRGETPIWTIRKEYDADELTDDDDSVGMAIDVEFISIGTTHREYLVSYDYLVRRMKQNGFLPLTKEECAALKLKHSTNMFSESYEMAKKAGKTYEMTDAVKEFSFLNRWFIFKRAGLAEMEDTADVEVAMKRLADADRTAAEGEAGTGNVVVEADANDEGENEGEGEGEDEDGVNEGAPASAVATPAMGAVLPGPDKKFAQSEIFLFGTTVAQQDTLKIKDPNAGRWLSLNSLFPIRDPEEAGVEYPSVTHFLAAMTLKHGAGKPDLAKTLFSSSGSIHQRFQAMRTAKSASVDEILKQEIEAVKKALMPSDLRAYKATIDPAKWNAKKNEVLKEALTQRWKRDARLHKIVEAAREKGKYLLYYTGSTGAGAWLSGVRRSTGVIEGENQVGRILMELAGFRFE